MISPPDHDSSQTSTESSNDHDVMLVCAEGAVVRARIQAVLKCGTFKDLLEDTVDGDIASVGWKQIPVRNLQAGTVQRVLAYASLLGPQSTPPNADKSTAYLGSIFRALRCKVADVLAAPVEQCRQNQGNKATEEEQLQRVAEAAIEAAVARVTAHAISDLVYAANYLDLPPLVELLTRTVGDAICAESIRLGVLWKPQNKIIPEIEPAASNRRHQGTDQDGDNLPGGDGFAMVHPLDVCGKTPLGLVLVELHEHEPALVEMAADHYGNEVLGAVAEARAAMMWGRYPQERTANMAIGSCSLRPVEIPPLCNRESAREH